MNGLQTVVAIVAGAIFFYFLFKKLSPAGVVAALLMAVAIGAGTGYAGLVFIGSFFLLGVAATAFERDKKEAMGYAEHNKGKRNAGQVLANGGLPMLLGALTWWLPQHKDLMLLLTACAVSSATADTLSSELGMVWGKRTFNILSWRRDKRGENGVVSMEGLAAGVGGSAIIALLYFLMVESGSLQKTLIVMLAGTVGNLTDSVLGATAERKNLLGNNAVNFLNTLLAALTGFLLASGF